MAEAMIRCQKCGHQWKPKVDQPRRCPNCKTSAYMYPPGVGFAFGKVYQTDVIHLSEIGEMSDLEALPAHESIMGPVVSVPVVKGENPIETIIKGLDKLANDPNTTELCPNCRDGSCYRHQLVTKPPAQNKLDK